MGVLACNRNGCENVMCDRLSDEYGYICDECFEELCESDNFTNIEDFMKSKKGGSSNNKEAIYAYMDKVFPLMRD